MLYFPQINSNQILTQTPYTSGAEFETVATDMESGMRWSFSRRGNTNLTGYAPGPLGKFNINFPSIIDSEVGILRAFMETTKGGYRAFRFLDPAGNLLKYSEDFTPSDWAKNDVSIMGSAPNDPFGGSNKSTQLLSTSADASLVATIGPSDGGLQGFVVNASVWLRRRGYLNTTIQLGIMDSTGNIGASKLVALTQTWKRYSLTCTLWDNNYFRVVLGGSSTWSGIPIDVFGFQVSPSKGECAYAASPDNYGYHPNVHFSSSTFTQQAVGPNQSSVVLPCQEYIASSTQKSPVSITLSIVTQLVSNGGSPIISMWGKNGNVLEDWAFRPAISRGADSHSKRTDTYDLMPCSILWVTEFDHSYASGTQPYDDGSLAKILRTLSVSFGMWQTAFLAPGLSQLFVYGAYVDVTFDDSTTQRYWATTAVAMPTQNTDPDLGPSSAIFNPELAVDGDLVDCCTIEDYWYPTWDPAWLWLSDFA